MIQRNAIKSWTLLSSQYKIILLGDDEGVSDVAKEFNVKHIANVECNKFGTPLLNSAFNLVKKNNKNNLLCYVNADIIFLKNFTKAIKKLPKKNFLAVGQRINLNVKQKINFENNNLIKKIKNNGKIQSPSAIDYFIFGHKSFKNLPPFAVGRVGWDNWMISEARKKKLKTIDTTEAITAVHQNHDYPAYNKDTKRKTNPEAKKNLSFIKNNACVFTIKDTSWKLTKFGLKKKWFYWWLFWKRYIKLWIKKFN